MIIGIAPSSGTTAGGNPVVISGANFTTPRVISVAFGATAATFTINSDSTITATAPAGEPGSITVVVTNAAGSATTTYGYTPGLSLSPSQGPMAGGTTVDIYGTGLGGADLTGTSVVWFGYLKAKSFTHLSATHLQAVNPAGAGEVPVIVRARDVTSAQGHFYYLPPPFTSSISPNAGLTEGGTTVTISGTNLFSTADVTFGAAPSVIASATGSSIITSAPAATTGPVAVVVHTAGGSTRGLTFTYIDAPTITALTPTSGPDTGGTAVTITGTNLMTTQEVTFAGTAAAAFRTISDTQILAVTPPGPDQAVDVTLTSKVGSVTDTSAFTYAPGPII
ncbi:IPT/TIG domain-containing protein [Streptomyces sioyaensis]|uniref:IPT/TIG domain-containing protein n=1 Tax=Streptomyces sioyaensis TaxID=67364 RepID=UPI0037D8AE1B